MDALYRFCAALFVLGLLGLLWLFTKRMNTGSSALLLRWPKGNVSGKFWGSSDKPVDVVVLQRVHLTTGHQLHFVQAGDRRILICTHSRGCSLLMTEHAANQKNVAASQENVAFSESEVFADARNAG